MSFHLPTKSECDAICEQTAAFYRRDRKVEGFNVAIYDYRLASLSDFIQYNAFELRGLCFVENTASSWERNLLMNKFFNINQTKGWMYDDVKDKEIVSVTNKEDGSIISFVKFPNGKVRAKSKASFDSTQAEMAQKVYNENGSLRKFVENCISLHEVPIFELVSPENQIVLVYPETELVLLQIRTENGDYASRKIAAYADEFGISCREEFNNNCHKNLDYLLDQKDKNKEDIEGWVVSFGDGQMAKIKTNKYLSIHGLLAPNNIRENLIVETILDGNIDDVISVCTGRKRIELEKVNEQVEKAFNNYVVELIRLHDEFCNKHNRNRKSFAIKYSNQHTLFPTFMSSVSKEEDFSKVEELAENSAKSFIKKNCKTVSSAKTFLESLQ